MNEYSTEERVLRVPEVRKRLDLKTDDSVYMLIRQGQLRAIRVGRLIRVPESALADFIAGGSSGK